VIVPMENVFSIENLYDEDFSKKFQLEKSNLNVEKIKTLFSSASTNTCKEDLFTHLKTVLLSHVTKSFGYEISRKFLITSYDKLLVGTSATRIAANLISFTCKGRGFALPDELAAMATKFNGNVTIFFSCLNKRSSFLATFARLSCEGNCYLQSTLEHHKSNDNYFEYKGKC
jgi:hypothetical protein